MDKINKIRVNTSTPYDVLIERGSLEKCGKIIADTVKSRTAVIITDDKVNSIYGDTVKKSMEYSGFTVSVFEFSNGEASKNSETLNRIYDFLCEKNITRSDILIALGGGVVGDITGFASATFLRGIGFIQIPTTLLAQIDSSVGGKTAIDLKGGKNLVGAFKQPELVICDSNTLKTLTPEFLSDGMAEAIKYGMIRDSELFELIASHNLNNVDEIMDRMVYTCIDIKRQVVENDEFDKGERMILNFGHTLGHAVEGYYNYKTYTHGCGVAVGMCMITKKLCSDEIYKKLTECLENYNLPTSVPVSSDKLLPFCSKDKKRNGGNLNYILCREIGKAEIINTTVEDFNNLMSDTGEI